MHSGSGLYIYIAEYRNQDSSVTPGSSEKHHRLFVTSAWYCLEQCTRRKSLRFFGIKESQGENTDDVIIKLSSEILKVDLTKDDLDRTHRVGPSREPVRKDDKPRAIIVKFSSYRKRREIIANRRKFAGKRMSILEDLTARNAILLNQARLDEKVKSAWSIDGRIFAISKQSDSVKKLITCKRDIDNL